MNLLRQAPLAHIRLLESLPLALAERIDLIRNYVKLEPSCEVHAMKAILRLQGRVELTRQAVSRSNSPRRRLA